jgi:L,D-peptidoglycan transpeptidase YkuD (ErfK/YbiS/YcfS/YnhG family)
MRIDVIPDAKPAYAGKLLWLGRTYKCVLGRTGATATKHEGDGATPRGRFYLREVLYRADRLDRPNTLLPVRPLRPTDGWCDAPVDPNYNRAVTHPYPASAEKLWRDDGPYDLMVILGYNDTPVVPGAGSAIFFHIAAPDFGPTDGCVAVAGDDLVMILAGCTPDTQIDIT